MRKRVAAAVATTALPFTLLVNTQTAQADGCSYYNNAPPYGNWPLCEIGTPGVPRINVGGGRPDLTAKTSAWCRDNYIKASSTGYTWWVLVVNNKHDRTFALDYYERVYRAFYWDGWQWKWVVINGFRDNPEGALRQYIYCDA